MIIDTFFQDLRIGLRVLIKEKGFCALAVFVLAVGIGAVTTQYAVVNGVLLRGFKFRAAERLVDVQLADPEKFTPNNFNSRMTTADFADLKEQQKSFEDWVGYLNGSTVNLTYNGQPKRLTGGYITYDFFRALGVSPVLGRDFLPEEDRAGVDKAVILSDALWHRDFGGDPGVIGKAVRVNGRTGTIVGVMPPKFQFPSNEELWIPVNAEFPVKPRNDRGVNFISVIARLKPGVSPEQAASEISSIAKGFATAYPDTNKQFTLGYVRPLIAAFTGGQLNILLFTMLAFCVGVLLIACVNVMNMQFARATLRAKELAIRSSLGATRVRLIRQMLTESLLVATIGAVVGVGIAFWTTDYLDLYVHAANPIPAWMTFNIDTKVLLVVVGATMLSAVVSGFVPAWLSSRASAIDALKEGGRGNTSRSVGIITRGLVIFQITLTCVLLIVAMLQVQSIVRQQTIDYGYDLSAVLGNRMGLMEGDYPTSEKRQLFYEKLLRELRAAPQFEAVALTNRFRMVFSGNGPIEIEGKEYKQDSDRTTSEFENVTPGYNDVLGQKLIEGRYLTEEDSEQKMPVAVVNATFAKKHFNGQALGRRFRTINQNGTQPGPWRQVVGVVTDVRMAGPFNNKSDGTGFYVPFFDTAFGPAAATPQAQQFGTALIRPRGGQRPEALAAAVQNIVNKVDPNLPLYFVGTPKSAIDTFLSQNRLVAVMFAVFGAIAVLLASVGLYGVMSFSVNQRSQEFGVRMALGADAARILRMVLRQGVWQIGIGLSLGLLLTLPAALLAGDAIINALTLFQITPSDPLTYVSVSLLIIVVSLFATLVPARRATRVDPMVALRAE
ncbi:ABC transporter permease [Opitutus sp. GAS368]|jgi:putative ABC transport system permease protein|uniref:ABC transporter permease n=1 Tax=Opitutus sp. GAS368 TaxID=1882749 RepID=UPI00087A9AE0|nr:ABC transporter permease [Opitutus sp. GAS368]SDS66040.1 duplicated orphan permease [Opitutus sp. GAS368]